MSRVDSYESERLAQPIRTCVGCRERADSAELLRVVVDQHEGKFVLVPDPLHRAPGRGAHVHPRSECLDLAERRRAFARALRVQAALDVGAIRDWLDGVKVRNVIAEDDMSAHPREEFGAGK